MKTRMGNEDWRRESSNIAAKYTVFLRHILLFHAAYSLQKTTETRFFLVHKIFEAFKKGDFGTKK